MECRALLPASGLLTATPHICLQVRAARICVQLYGEDQRRLTHHVSHKWKQLHLFSSIPSNQIDHQLTRFAIMMLISTSTHIVVAASPVHVTGCGSVSLCMFVEHRGPSSHPQVTHPAHPEGGHVALGGKVCTLRRLAPRHPLEVKRA